MTPKGFRRTSFAAYTPGDSSATRATRAGPHRPALDIGTGSGVQAMLFGAVMARDGPLDGRQILAALAFADLNAALKREFTNSSAGLGTGSKLGVDGEPFRVITSTARSSSSRRKPWVACRDCGLEAETASSD